MSAVTAEAGPREGKHAGQPDGPCWDSHYAEEWAKRHPFGQARIEAHRIKSGKATHRAHRKLLKIRGPK